jgi:hypothetical protein
MIMAPRIAYRQPQAGSQGFARTKKVFGGPTITLIAADVALNAQAAILRVPAGFVMQSGTFTFGACDSGATLTMGIGDVANTTRFAAASTVPRAGGSVTLTGVPYTFTADTDLIVTASAAAAGLGATPTVVGLVEGYIGP